MSFGPDETPPSPTAHRGSQSEWEPVEAVWALLDRPEWHQKAACKGVGADMFYPERGDNAKFLVAQFCAHCPVVEPCAEAGKRESFGVWGGRTARQRIRTRQGRPL